MTGKWQGRTGWLSVIKNIVSLIMLLIILLHCQTLLSFLYALRKIQRSTISATFRIVLEFPAWKYILVTEQPKVFWRKALSRVSYPPKIAMNKLNTCNCFLNLHIECKCFLFLSREQSKMCSVYIPKFNSNLLKVFMAIENATMAVLLLLKAQYGC